MDDSDIVWLSDAGNNSPVQPIASTNEGEISPEVSIVQDTFLNRSDKGPYTSTPITPPITLEKIEFEKDFAVWRRKNEVNLTPVTRSSPKRRSGFRPIVKDSPNLRLNDNPNLSSPKLIRLSPTVPISDKRDRAENNTPTRPADEFEFDSAGCPMKNGHYYLSGYVWTRLNPTPPGPLPAFPVLSDYLKSKRFGYVLEDIPRRKNSGNNDKEPEKLCNKEATRADKAAKAAEREKKRSEKAKENAIKVVEREINQKKRQLEKQQKETEKKKARIEREMAAATKSGAERHLFCHIRRALFQKYDGLESALRCAFMDRELGKQLVIEDSGDFNLIEFHRNNIDMQETADGNVEKFEYKQMQPFFIYVIDGDELTTEFKSFETNVDSIKTKLPILPADLVIACLGEPKISIKKIFKFNINIFASLRAQLKICGKVDLLAHYLLQITRGLAKYNPMTSHSHPQFQDGDKGIRKGPDLVKNWWDLMLSTIYRLSDASRRALIGKIPTPVDGIDWIRRVGIDKATKDISNLVGEGGRRVGMAMAVRVVRMLSDMEGTSIVQ